MGKIIKKHERGAATNYVTRKAAMKKLQLTPKDFRRLCILKGIHPHEPKHKKKVNKGSTDVKTWYYAKDIAFLLHEPIINKFREYKVFMRKVTKYKNKNEDDRVKRLFDNKPAYILDHVVKERYPTFVDAVRDLDDALCLCFLFARLPRSSKVPAERTSLCRRLTSEFMLYVIAAKALRKVFVSIKGIYYQADVFGQTVTWVVPHDRGIPLITAVDFQVMSTFVEFYTTALGFVNFRLFRHLGLRYPPIPDHDNTDSKVDILGETDDAEFERIYALGDVLLKSLSESAKIEEPTVDDFNNADSGSIDDDLIKKQEKLKNLPNLFSKCKFFLSREVPRESLTFVIRSCEGKASWDSVMASGSMYDETDASITHQIIDRPNVEKQFLSRRYIQPQWVYDCINAGTLLPMEDYFPGSVLPAHLSPFVVETESEYVPPEKIRLLEMQGEDVSKFHTADGEDIAEPSVKAPENPTSAKILKKAQKSAEKGIMTVRTGKVDIAPKGNSSTEATENKKLREMMIPKKQRRVYKKIQKKIKHVSKEVENLKKKRKEHDNSKQFAVNS